MGTTITVYPWHADPLALAFGQTRTADVRGAVAANGNPPRLFNAGASYLPAFTASGVDPADLIELPWGCRHYAASEPDRGTVYATFDQYADDATAYLTSPGFTDYLRQFQNWLIRRPTADEFAAMSPDRQQAYRDSAGTMYDAMFGADDAARRARLDARSAGGVNAADWAGSRVGAR